MTLPFSPLRDQPHYIYRTAEQTPDLLAQAERMYPGVLAYGHLHNSRKWFRLTKDGNEYGTFDYFRIFVPVNCAWLFEDFIGEFHHPEVEHAVNVENIFAWPSDDPEALDQMAEYGRDIARRLVRDGELREHVPDMLTPYQCRGVYWAATRPYLKLVYPCGCLSGDTELVVNRNGKSMRMSLSQLVHKFNGGKSRGRMWGPAPTYVQSMDADGYRVLNQVEAAFVSGEKDVYEVTTERGHVVKATKDHRFWTPFGWRRLHQISEGDEVAVMWTHGKRAWPEFCRIKSITSKGREMTYDLSMAAPNHNFVANEFVVHNSGKTLTAFIAGLVRRGPIAIIAPAKARRVWWDQVQEYSHLVPHRVIPEGQRRRGDLTTEEYLEQERRAGRRPVVIFGSQSLPDYMDDLYLVMPQALVYDELHTFGQPKRWTAEFDARGEIIFHKRKTSTNTRETRAVAAMDASRLSSLQFRCGLTATPLDDGRPRRAWAQLDLLDPGGFGLGYSAFAKRYCDAREGEYGGLEDKGSSNIDELKLRASFLMQEVTHSESHGSLPPTRLQVVWLEPSDQNRPAAFRKVINAAEKQAAKTSTTFDRERALEANLMEAASRKRKYVIEEALEGLRGSGKVVLFTGRRLDCEAWADDIRKALEKEVRRGLYGGVMPDLWWGHGGTPESEREDMVAAFRDSDGPCILIGTGQAFGESLDGMQNADLAIFAMLPWRPGDLIQWRGRFDRLGGRPTLLKIVLAKQTYDEKVAGLLADKIAPIKEYLVAEQYQGLDNQLLGTDNKEAMRASILKSLFGDEE